MRAARSAYCWTIVGRPRQRYCSKPYERERMVLPRLGAIRPRSRSLRDRRDCNLSYGAGALGARPPARWLTTQRASVSMIVAQRRGALIRWTSSPPEASPRRCATARFAYLPCGPITGRVVFPGCALGVVCCRNLRSRPHGDYAALVAGELAVREARTGDARAIAEVSVASRRWS